VVGSTRPTSGSRVATSAMFLVSWWTLPQPLRCSVPLWPSEVRLTRTALMERSSSLQSLWTGTKTVRSDGQGGQRARCNQRHHCRRESAALRLLADAAAHGAGPRQAHSGPARARLSRVAHRTAHRGQLQRCAGHPRRLRACRIRGYLEPASSTHGPCALAI